MQKSNLLILCLVQMFLNIKTRHDAIESIEGLPDRCDRTKVALVVVAPSIMMNQVIFVAIVSRCRQLLDHIAPITPSPVVVIHQIVQNQNSHHGG